MDQTRDLRHPVCSDAMDGDVPWATDTVARFDQRSGEPQVTGSPSGESGNLVRPRCQRMVAKMRGHCEQQPVIAFGRGLSLGPGAFQQDVVDITARAAEQAVVQRAASSAVRRARSRAIVC